MLQQNNIRPKYEVEKLEGTVKRTVLTRDKELNINVEKTEEVDAGYMVYFPRGHSLRVADEAELKRLGFDKPADLIDEDGEVVGSTEQLSLKRSVQRRAGASRKAATSSIDANQED